MTKAIEPNRMRPLHALAWLLLTALLSLSARAADSTPQSAQAKALLETLRIVHPGTRFSEVLPTDVPGIYEVLMNGNVAYVSPASPHLFLFGRLFDTRDMRDLTASKFAQREGDGTGEADDPNDRPSLKQLPLADAITVRRGDGSREIVLFSDPSCVYCKQLEVELEALDDVTIHTFLVPFQGESRPIAIWCSADRVSAWRQWMLHSSSAELRPETHCAHPIARNLALARALGVRGTPTIFWADGSRTDGFVERIVLRGALERAASSGASAIKPPGARP
jgi:thiol:disulfide interchange protein DsbC